MGRFGFEIGVIKPLLVLEVLVLFQNGEQRVCTGERTVAQQLSKYFTLQKKQFMGMKDYWE